MRDAGDDMEWDKGRYRIKEMRRIVVVDNGKEEKGSGHWEGDEKYCTGYWVMAVTEDWGIKWRRLEYDKWQLVY